MIFRTFFIKCKTTNILTSESVKYWKGKRGILPLHKSCICVNFSIE